MFYSSNFLNEGGNTEKSDNNKQREFCEGENPKINQQNWYSLKSGQHVNSKWQNLRGK